MEFKKSKYFNQHRNWCGKSANHKFCECPYNKDNAKQYFRAPCCDRWVQFLVGFGKCKKCEKHYQDWERRPRDEYEPQIFSLTHRFDEDQLDRILSKVTQGASDVVNDLRGSVSGLLDDVGSATSEIIVKITLALGLIWRVKDDKVAVVLTIVQFLTSMGVTMSLIRSFESYVMKLVEGYQCQAPCCEDIFNVVAMFLSLITLRSVPAKYKLVQFFRDMCSIHNFSKTATSILTTVKDMILLGVRFVQETFLGYSPVWAEEGPHDAIITWCDQVDDLHKRQTQVPWDQIMLD